MLDGFYDQPGLLFVVATLLPMAAFVLLLLAGAARSFLRNQRHGNAAADALFHALGGEVTGRGPAYVALAAIALACVCSVIGFVTYLQEHEKNELELTRIDVAYHGAQDNVHHGETSEAKAEAEKEVAALDKERRDIERRWADSWVWASVHPAG